MVDSQIHLQRHPSRTISWYFERYFLTPVVHLGSSFGAALAGYRQPLRAALRQARLLVWGRLIGLLIYQLFFLLVGGMLRMLGTSIDYLAERAQRRALSKRMFAAAKAARAQTRAAWRAHRQRHLSFGFGLEKIGIVGMSWPKTSFVLLLLATVFGALGLPKLLPQAHLSELFRANTPIYRDFETLGKLFPTSEYDTLVVVEGKDLMTPEKLEQLRALHLELQFAKGVEGVLSMFSMRTEPDAQGKSKPLFPNVIPTGKQFEELKAKLLAHPLIKNRFLAAGGKDGKDIAMMVISLKPNVVQGNGFGVAFADIQRIANETLGVTPASGAVAPAAEVEADDIPNDGDRDLPSPEELDKLQQEAPKDNSDEVGEAELLALQNQLEPMGAADGRGVTAKAKGPQRGMGPFGGSFEPTSSHNSHNSKDGQRLGFGAPAPDQEDELLADPDLGSVGKDLGLRAQFAGVPVMQHEIRSSIRADRLKFNIVGFILGTFIAFLFFRRPAFVIIASVPPAIATIWILGLLGHAGQELSALKNVIPPLIMVIAFSDAMHMMFAIRRRILDGADRWQAARSAIAHVGPACVLTSLTTSLALLSLALFTDSIPIREFSYAAAGGTLLAFIAVVVAVPTLSVLFLRDEEKLRRSEQGRNDLIAVLDRGSLRFANWLTRYYAPVAVIGILLTIVLGAMHAQLTPKYALQDQLPDGKQALTASRTVDAKLAGSYPVHVLMRWRKPAATASAQTVAQAGVSEAKSEAASEVKIKSAAKDKTVPVESPEIMAAIFETHRMMEVMKELGNVWSVEVVRRSLEKRGIKSEKALRAYLDLMPPHVYKRFVNDAANAALITGYIRNMSAEEIAAVVERLKANLKTIEAQFPNVQFTVTGLSPVSAIQSKRMINQLNMGFVSAVGIVLIFIGLAFRSFKVSLLSVIPNLFPIVVIGAYLYLSGDGLRFASVLALTVAFGLAVDDTIHFLNRFAIERQRTDEIKKAVRQTIARIGPVLILTTLVLVCGLSVTILSSLPVTRLFGELSMATLSAALLADLLILPAIILAFAGLKRGVSSRKDKRAAKGGQAYATAA